MFTIETVRDEDKKVVGFVAYRGVDIVARVSETEAAAGRRVDLCAVLTVAELQQLSSAILAAK